MSNTQDSQPDSGYNSPSLDKQKSTTEVTQINDLLEEKVQEITHRIIDVLATYFWHSSDESGNTRATEWPGREMFSGHVAHWVRTEQPVQMVLPAFPFKSSNLDKVTSALPDFAEYLGLSRLNQMCLDVRKVYSLGAQILLAADGVVFNDLLLISDTNVWKYGQAVTEMVRANHFQSNIRVLQPQELLGMVTQEELTEEKFYETTNTCRDSILAQFTRAEEEMQDLVDNDPDSRLTYSGMKAFVKVDQERSIYRTQAVSKKAFLRDMASLALKMLARSEGFGKLIRNRLPHHVRLSIHPSSGLAKLSICLLPQPKGSVARAPWMSCIAVDDKGNYLSAHSKEVKGGYDLIYRNNKPWLFRERSECYQLDPEHQKHWQIEHIYPSGLRISRRTAENSTTYGPNSIIPSDIGDKLQQVAEWQPVQIVV